MKERDSAMCHPIRMARVPIRVALNRSVIGVQISTRLTYDAVRRIDRLNESWPLNGLEPA
jgi:hypothetical protein